MQAFTDHYFSTFDTARANLAGLYQDQSMLTFEGQKFQGTQAVSGWRRACQHPAAHPARHRLCLRCHQCCAKLRQRCAKR